MIGYYLEANSTQLLGWMEFDIEMHILPFFLYFTFVILISGSFEFVFGALVLHAAIKCPAQQKVDYFKQCSGSRSHIFSPLN